VAPPQRVRQALSRSWISLAELTDSQRLVEDRYSLAQTMSMAIRLLGGMPSETFAASEDVKGIGSRGRPILSENQQNEAPR
jgi:hypothetical protein